jgi:hypothetical protein
MSPLMNMYDEIRANLHFNKFTVGELLFVEYKCPIEQDAAGLWTPLDYFVHVLSGKKTWRTTEGTWTLDAGKRSGEVFGRVSYAGLKHVAPGGD